MLTNKTFNEIEVGDTVSISRTLTKRDVDMFAMISGDMNPTHVSDQFAKMLMESQKVSGHSMWGATLISSLLGNDLPGPGTVYKSQQLFFHGAVDLGDTLNVMIRVKEKHDDGKTVVFDCRVVNQHDEAIITGDAVVQAPPKKPTADADWLDDMKYYPRRAFQNLIAKVREYEPITMAVCHPCSRTALEGAVDAAEANLVTPILVGPTDRIRKVAEENDIDIGPFEIVDTRHSHGSAAKAVALCRSGAAEVLMKGSLHTDEIMSAVVKRDTGLRTELRLSHVFIMDVPTYPKPLFLTDAAINIYPDLEAKVHIVKNAIALAHSLKIKEPKIAILSAVETINPKIPSTLEAAALCKMAGRGQISGAIIDGPLAFDNAISKEAAVIKGIVSPVSGETDIFVVPDLEAGNMLAKQLQYLVSADAAGIVLGARVPFVLTSRADSPKARLASCAVAVAVAEARRKGIVKGGAA